MSWALEDHTADLRLRVEAAGWTELLREAALAFGELVGGGPPPAGPREERAIEVEGIDTVETWVRYWRALHRLWSVESLLPVDARVEPDATPLRVRAHVACIAAERLDLRHCEDVKAVTWHAAEATETDGGWRGRVVLDV